MIDTPPLGRRERKKAATRKKISDVATAMFLERGFDDVSVREVAEAADVSPTTVFSYFPQKEALVFDEDDEQREALTAAVRERAPGTTVAAALRQFYAAEARINLNEHGDGVMRQFQEFLDGVPALREYAGKMWLRHEGALAETIADELGVAASVPEVRVFARMVLQVQLMMNDSDDPLATLEAGFAVLENGWRAVEAGLVKR